jgi:exopolyphosphatase/guanosine-5'-triphosphate,3'-diphosphate pyrophosphatase
VAGTDIVAVIDIGSNSIKSLVAARGARGELHTLKAGAIDARISKGLGRVPPRLSEDGMRSGVEAIQRLLADFASPTTRTILVATSAVRDAVNGPEFQARVRDATGGDLRILSGAEEADLIGRGLLTDPALGALRDFYVFDLGGGSLECLTFRTRQVMQVVSLPLGCVRLTERCVADPAAPFSAVSRTRVTGNCQEVLAKSGFRFDLPTSSSAVFTGGTMTTIRAVLAARRGQPMEDAAPIIPVAAIHALLDEVAPLPLDARRLIAGLPAARADVFPTALATVLAVAGAGGFSAFHHSFHNLRYGLAAEALGLPA